ncbi:MAG: DUF1015 domain-containing protein [Bacilli bacterium]|nr:DUF1015 domain-containing protein [Bacilli bacterium]MBN2696100.1 DUF1015 domain-containing protein [Bacilli bacterium]
MEVVSCPELLLPKEFIDLHKWAVIACDQFTSEKNYWVQLDQLVDNVPSSYHIILPEAYLDLGFETRITAVNENMDLYLRSGMFDKRQGIVLVERMTPFHAKRLGIMVLIDLEHYEYLEGKDGRIIASEKTVLERIPPRVKIREHAPIEIPHVLVLIDDKEKIIENLDKQKLMLEKLYDFDLNMGGGHVKGYLIKESQLILDKINELVEKTPLIVGDGNHSLAAAKVHWENLKNQHDSLYLQNHPARYALVELTSIYDPGLAFEPIHRVVFGADDEFIHELNRASYGSEALRIITETKEDYILTPTSPFETICWVQDFLDEYIQEHPEVAIDYVHGMDSLKKIIQDNPGAVGITLPPLERNQLFPYIKEKGVLPRKSFSLGEAVEKRYYLESRVIQKGKM